MSASIYSTCRNAYLFSVLACLLLAFPEVVFCASPSLDAKQNNSIVISDEEGLTFAARLFEAGRTNDAKQTYGLLMQSRKATVRNEAAFLLSQIYVLEQDYAKTIELLIPVLNSSPKLARVRLELARAYFLNEN